MALDDLEAALRTDSIQAGGRRGISATTARARIQQIQQAMGEEILELFGVGMENMLKQVIADVTSQSMYSALAYMNMMQNDWSDVRQGLVSDARTMGEKVKEQALAIAEEHVREVDPRIENRLHGRLQEAIEQMVEGTQDGVVVRVDILDRTARHWRRINYGVGEQAGDGLSAQIANLVQSGPSTAAMEIPRGFWSSGGKSVPWGKGRNDFFRPLASEPKFPTRGIAGKHFLERGFEVAEDLFPTLVRDRVKKWETLTPGGGKGRKVMGVLR